jgi:hypothetical protein
MPTIQMKHEEMLPFFAMHCDCTLEDPFGAPPTEVIRTNQKWGVRFKWDTTGWLPRVMNPSTEWVLQLHLEGWDPGEGPPIPAITKTIKPTDPAVYNEYFEVDPAVVPINDGIYKLAASLRLRLGNIPLPVAAHAEGPMLQFYTSPLP